MSTEPTNRGGKRQGAGRKSEGKERHNLTLTATVVQATKAKVSNLSRHVDVLLAKWLQENR